MHETYDQDAPAVSKGAQARVHARVGIIGGGQLARMTMLAGRQLGCSFVVLERNERSPALEMASDGIIGDWDDPAVLARLAAQTDVVTFENEFVSAEALAAVERQGYLVYPTSSTLRLVQDKFLQKQALAEAGLAVPRFMAIQTQADILRAGAELGWPIVLKRRRNGYDGKGNLTIRSAAEVELAWGRLGGVPNALMVEEFCPFVAELAVIVTRGRDGHLARYPLVESIQREHICHAVKAPALVAPAVADAALRMAEAAVVTVGMVGSLGVEMFLTADGHVVLNELAPRVHNSGHYTIEACVCSQFENHLRAVLGWPLGSTTMRAPAAVMVNLLGTQKGPGRASGLERALAVSGAHLHLYGKAMSGPGRKMGHVTALGATVDEAWRTAHEAGAAIRFGNYE